MAKKTDTPALTRWRRSWQFRAIATAAARTGRIKIAATERCGAKRKSDHEPCAQPAMENGRCYLHGGKTPRGDKWHVPQWPDPNVPGWQKKLEGKLSALERRKKEKTARLNAMTGEERVRHAEWQRTHKPGSSSARAVARRCRLQAAAARKDFATERPTQENLELMELQRQIDDLKAQLREIEQVASDLPEIIDQGVFG